MAGWTSSRAGKRTWWARSGGRSGLQRTIGGLVAVVLALALLPFTAVAAHAAAGDYTVEIDAPASVPVRQGFSYDVTLAVEEASAGAPVEGIVLTSVLPAGVAYNTVDTGSSSPVQSASYDSGTRTVTFTLKPLVEQLVTFSFAVTQVDNNVKDDDTVFTTTITGSQTPSGATPRDDASTAVTGDHTYTPTKTSETSPGGTNRTVTYYFGINVDQGASTDTFASWGQRFTDTFPAGVEIVTTSPGWTRTNNPDGTTTMVWERTNNLYAPAAITSIPARSVSIQVNYPEASFATGTRPPVNVVDLETQSRNGTWHDQSPASTQGPVFQPAITEPKITVGKGFSGQVGMQNYNWTSGTIGRPSYTTAASYLDAGTGQRLESLTVTDSASQPGNAKFWEHFDTTRLDVRFTTILQNANLPYTFEYQTAAQPGVWQQYGSSLTTGTDQILAVQTAGSQGYEAAAAGNTGTINIPTGTYLNGWRVVVSPDAATTVPSGAEVQVYTQGTASFASLTGGSDAVPETVNTATGTGTTTGGVALDASDPMSVTIADRVNLITQVFAPASITVGQPATYNVAVANRDPAGRTYIDDEVRVVLPVGVYYTGAAIERQRATTPLGRDVPAIGDGVTVTTTTMTMPDGEHQVLVFAFDEIPSLNAVGTAKHERPIFGNETYEYRIPTSVQPQAFKGASVQAPVDSWAWTADPDYTTVPQALQSGYFADDTYDFDPNRTSISKSTARSNVLTSGGLLLGKLVRADNNASWSVNAMVSSPGTADYQVYVQNALPNAVTDLVLFDRLPATGDGRDSEFGVTLAGPVQGVPAGATVEYSTNATTATNGTWTTNPAGATAYRLNIPSFAPAQNFTLTFTVNVPSDLTGESAVNDVTATGMYGGSSRNFTSPSAQIQTPAPPQAGDASETINPNETATLNPTVTPGTGAITGVTFDDGSTTKVVAGEGTWSIELVAGQPVATFTPEADYHGDVTPQEYTVTDENGFTASGELSVRINVPPQTPDQTRVINPNEVAYFNDGAQMGSAYFAGGALDNGQASKVVPGEGTWSNFKMDTNGDFTVEFTPEPDYCGPVTPMVYTATDLNGLTATGTLTVEINCPPQAGDDSATINPGETATLNPTVTPGTGAIESAVFDNGETTKVVDGEGTWSIAVDDEGNVTATFTPEDGYFGPVTPQEYTVTDENGLTASGELTVEINDPPQAEDAATTVPQGETATLNPVVTPGNSPIVKVTFSDGSTEILVPGEGAWTIELNDAGEVVATFTPESGFYGVATPQEYIVTDENGLTATAELAVTVIGTKPSMDLVKSAHLNDKNGNGKADEGETIDYSFLVTNTGSTQLTDVGVDDPMLAQLGTGVTCSPTTLDPGGKAECAADKAYTVTAQDVKNGKVYNVATAHGTPPEGIEPPAEPKADVEVPTGPVARGGLAVTGGQVMWPMIGAGVFAVLAGGLLLLIRRRNRETRRS